MQQSLNSNKPRLLSESKLEKLHSYISNFCLIFCNEPELENLLGISMDIKEIYADNEAQLAEAFSKQELAFLKRVVNNLNLNARSHIYNLRMQDHYHPFRVFRLSRDKVMTDTLLFLAKKYFPNEKIIVWASADKTLRNKDLIECNGNKPFQYKKIMGEFLANEPGEEIYSIGFITYEGECGFSSGFANEIIQPAPEGTLSWYFHELGGRYYFLDFKSLNSNNWLRKKSSARPFRGSSSCDAPWPEIFDAFVYIKKTQPVQLWSE